MLLIGRNWSTRGNNNDFEHFLNFFPGSISSTSNELNSFDNRFFRCVKNKTLNSCYSSLSVALEYNAFIKFINHDIKLVHYWFGDHDYYYGYWFKRIFGAKIVINLFFSLEELQRRMPNKFHLQNADLITCSGKAQLEYLKQFIDKKKLAYLPLGVDTNFFTLPKNNNYRDKDLIICIGNNRRDYKILKKVYLRLKSIKPNIKLKLAGSEPGKSFFTDLPEVEFFPFLDDLKFRKLYRKASLLVLPLLEGGSSQTLNEALACGLPIITNKFPNLSDYTKTNAVIQHTPGDYIGMSDTCLEVLDNKKKHLEMSNAARRHILKFDFVNIKDKLINIYSDYLDLNIVVDN